jgi:hypothetical protein
MVKFHTTSFQREYFTMSFNKIAAIVLTAGASIAFAGAANAATAPITTIFSKTVATACGITYLSPSTGSAPLTLSAPDTLSGSATYTVTCNQGGGVVSVAASSGNYNGGALPALTTGSATFTSGTVDFAGITSGVTTATSPAFGTSNGVVDVAAKIATTAASLPAGSYTLPVTVTLTY